MKDHRSSGEQGGDLRLTRRRLLGSAAAAGAAAALPGLAAEAAADPLVEAFSAAEDANVVVVVVDSVRSDHVGAYGGRRAHTPTLDALARESLVLTRARHETMPTVPVRKQLLTGQRLFPFRGWRPGVGGLPKVPGFEGIGKGETTFLDVLGRRGYLTGYVTDNPHLLRPAFAAFRSRVDSVRLVHGQVPGWRQKRGPVSAGRLRRHLAPELRGRDRGRVREHLGYNPAGRRESDYLTARVFRAGIDFLELAARRRKPFGLVVDTFDVHEPWDPPDSYLARYARIRRGGYRPIMPFPTPAGRAGDLSRRTLKLARALYAAEVTFLDAWLGHFLHRLDELGLTNTWVVVVSDHGVYLGEHGWIGKQAGDLHGELLDVPFLIRHPARIGAGRRSGYFASAHDIAPTVLRAVGAPVPRSMDGADLGPLLHGRAARKRPVWTSAWGTTLAAGDGRWLYTAANDSGRIVTEGLYDTRSDPRERRNLARRRPDLVRRFRGELAKAAGKKGLPRL